MSASWRNSVAESSSLRTSSFFGLRAVKQSGQEGSHGFPGIFGRVRTGQSNFQCLLAEMPPPGEHRSETAGHTAIVLKRLGIADRAVCPQTIEDIDPMTRLPKNKMTKRQLHSAALDLAYSQIGLKFASCPRQADV